MRPQLIGAVAVLACAPAAQAHALFPSVQTVQTVGDRALVRFQAVNGRRDVSEFLVEVFEGGGWSPSRIAVASPQRLVVPATEPGSGEVFDRAFSVLVDLDGRDEQSLRVCTKSIVRRSAARPLVNRVNTRVCANVTVRRFR